MKELLVFAMLGGFGSIVFVIGLLSKSTKKIEYTASPNQLSLPMQEADKPREMAAAHR